MTNTNKYDNIPAEKFQFSKRTDLYHDKQFDTKPVTYFQGAFRRFCKNKGAVVATVVIARWENVFDYDKMNCFLRTKNIKTNTLGRINGDVSFQSDFCKK